MKTEVVHYESGEKKLKGFLAYDEKIRGPRPAVLVVHAWYGQDDLAREKTIELANLGYIGFAVDMFGNEKPIQNDEEASKYMIPLFIDRKLLQERIQDGLKTLLKIKDVDSANVAAIGFCFGGLTALELLRSGAKISGAVSFHGALTSKIANHIAKTVPIANDIQGSLLILHGNLDPMVSLDDIVSMQSEFTKAKIDWQMHIYGNAYHAFTNPKAHDTHSGLVYNEKAAHRSWISMKDFFKEIFKVS